MAKEDGYVPRMEGLCNNKNRLARTRFKKFNFLRYNETTYYLPIYGAFLVQLIAINFEALNQCDQIWRNFATWAKF